MNKERKLSEKPLALPRSNGAKKNLMVGSFEDGCWPVEIKVDFKDASDDTLPKILRQAKRKISVMYNIPIGLLSYRNIKKKVIDETGVRLVANICQDEAESGDPVLRFLNAKSSQGIEYKEMALYLDIYPLKESGEELSNHDILQLLKKSEVPLTRIDFKAIERAMKTVQTDLVPVKNILLAQGRFPEPSFDAKLELLIDFKQVEDNKFIGMGKVQRDQHICRVTPHFKGRKDGYTVLDKAIKPPEPKIIELIAGDGISVTNEGTDVFAARGGILFMREDQAWNEPQLSRITFWLEPIEVVDGSKRVEITTENNIEVVGGLKTGSNLVSRGEVIINGDIANNTSVVASGNINVRGRINGAKLVSEKDIEQEGEVVSSKLIAKGKINVRGTVKDSELIGYEVHLEKVVGCKITAGIMIVVDTISVDENGFSGVILAGLTSQLSELIRENEELIEFSRNNLERFRHIVGEKIVATATTGNVSRLLMRFYKDIKKEGSYDLTWADSEALKKIIEAIGPMRNLLKEKTEQNKRLKIEIQKRVWEEPKIVVKTGVDSPIPIEISGTADQINPEDGAVIIQKSRGKILKRELDSRKIKYTTS